MDGARFDRLTRALASRRRLLGGLASTLAALALAVPARGATCKALGKPCTRQLECCSRTCLQPDGPDGRPQGRRRCLCANTLKLPCGGRCCTRQQTCKRGRCIHHCRDGRISGDESDQDCGGDDCKKCALFQLCNSPRDCTTGHCAPFPEAIGPEPRCAECLADGDCRDAAKPRCFTGDGAPGSGGICVQCVEDGHCPAARPLCETGTCVQCRDEVDCPPEAPFCLGSPGICSEDECVTGADCASGCCEAGECVNSFADSTTNCGACGNLCPGQFPQCVMCCSGICRNPPRGDPPGNECNCP